MVIDRVEYQKEKYIAFVDVLGFSSMVDDFKFNEYYDPKFNLTSKFAFFNNSFYSLKFFLSSLLFRGSLSIIKRFLFISLITLAPEYSKISGISNGCFCPK